MRVEFVAAMLAVLRHDPQAVLLTGDLGYNAFEELRATFPQRFINAGVAEQNMVGMAAGLALAGMHPWVYSIAPFAVYRCFEQIRNDVCLHNLTVRIVGNGGGYTYGIMGSTHHAMEDLGVLKTLPNMQLYFPCSNNQVQAVVQTIQATPGPAYLRLAISGFGADPPPLAEEPTTLLRTYAHGTQLTLVGIGHATQLAWTALQAMANKQAVALFGVARFPFGAAAQQLLQASLQRTGKLLLVDEHYRAGSLSESLQSSLPSAASSRLLCAQYDAKQHYGSSRFHAQQAGIAPAQIGAQMQALLQGSAA